MTGTTMPTVQIRAATAADVPAIVTLEHDHLAPGSWSEALVAPGVAGQLPSVGYLVADVGGLVVGHLVLSAVGDVAELQRIAVAPAHRRVGVAHSLVGAAAQRARSGGAERMLLEVREDNLGAQALYARLGFTEVHRRPRYYRDGATAVVLELELAAAP